MGQGRAGSLIIVSIFVMQAALAGVAAAATPVMAPTVSDNSPSYNESWWDDYHPTGDVYDLIEKIAAEHSNIVTLQTIGTTFEGRRLLVAKVSDNPGSDEADEPKYLVIAGTHAREWTTYHSAAYFLNYLTGHYRQDSDGDPVYAPAGSFDNDSYVTWLVNNREIYILVMVNPDGIEYSHTTEALWRKNREPNLGFIGLGCTGTDINRNFGFHWGEVQGDSHYACSDIYAGPTSIRTDGIGTARGWRPGDPNPGGFSTAEAIAIRDFETKIHFSTALSQHSYSGLVLYPWGYTGDPAPDYVYFRQMAEKMANWTGYTPQAGYDLYKVSGEWGDWSYGVTGAYSFTIEMGLTAFQPDKSEILNQSHLVLSSQLFLGETADDLHLTAPVVNVTAEPSVVVDPNTPQPVRAEIEAVNGLDGGEVVIVYSQNGGRTWATAPMQAGDDGMTYTGQLPGLAPGVEAMYYVRATDNEGIVRSGPFSAPYSAYFVTARNGVFEQIGTVGLIAILIGAGAAGVLVYFRFIRGRDLAFKFPALPSLRGFKLPRRQAQPAAAAAAPTRARARVKPAPTISGPANMADAKRAKDTPDFDSYVASRPRLQQFLDDDA